MTAEVPKRFRRLKFDEVPRSGDFVVNGGKGFERWEGPSGFRADSYVKAIYRLVTSGSSTIRKS
jgi:hypothetical protein